MCSILLLPLVARCLETIDVCIWHMFVFMYVVVTMGMFVVYRPLLKIMGFRAFPYLGRAGVELYEVEFCSNDTERRGLPWRFWTMPQTQWEGQWTGQRILKQL